MKLVHSKAGYDQEEAYFHREEKRLLGFNHVSYIKRVRRHCKSNSIYARGKTDFAQKYRRFARLYRARNHCKIYCSFIKSTKNMNKVLKYAALDILKNKIVIAYTVMLALFAWSAFSLEDNAAKGILTLLNIILLTVPLVSVLFSTIYVYNSSEFIELLVSQPIKRSKIWTALFIGLSLALVLAYIVGAGIPLLIFADLGTALMMIVAGSMLSIIFVAVAFLCSILTRDKAKGVGISLIVWLYFSLLFDGLVLFLFFQFADYPIEKIVVGLSALSPVDMCRILILLRLDVAAMLGMTGAVFKDNFGSGGGLLLSFGILALWIIIPFIISLKKFRKKDL